MDHIHNSPPLLKRKLFLTAWAGIACLLIGISVCIFAKDWIMLFLSCAVCLFSSINAVSLNWVLSENKYGITFLLPKQSKVKIGDRYRFYFKQTQRFSLDSDYFDAAMSSDCFLGYESLGETPPQ